MQENKWVLQEIDKEKLSDFQKQLSLPEIIVKVLLSRGFSSVESIQKFLSSDIKDLYNPFLFDDMYKSVLRIKQAIENQEKILIYADRDVDGITSLVVMFNTIKTLGGDVVWYIPSDEGYGLSNSVIEKYHNLGIKLIITVDCGISAANEIDFANGLGMEVVVTDHHEPPIDNLPKAYSIVDHKKISCKYPCKDLAGCGVSFKVSQALMQTYGKNFDKEISIVSLSQQENINNAYVITLINDIVIKEQTVSFNDKKELFEILKDSLIVSLESSIFDNIKNDIYFVKIENNKKELKDLAYEILRQYRKDVFEQDGRMLQFFEENVDLVAIGTIADIVPIVGENRILVRNGLKNLNDNPTRRYGLSNIINEYLANKKDISAKDISWNITPVLNAAGRMAKAEISANLLLADDKYEANDFFVELKQLNNERKSLQIENTKVFKKLLTEQCDIEKDKILVIVADNLSHGVTGIVAAQIVKKYSKPAILFISDGKEAVGACRSIEGFDMVGALDQTKDLLVKFGGHTQAAGLTISVDNIKSFRDRLSKIAENSISKEMVVKKFDVDCEVKLSDINKNLYSDLSLLEPFGCSNVSPVFLIRNVEFTEISVIGQTQEHLKLKVAQNGASVNALFWNGAKYQDIMHYKNKFDILFNMDINRGNIQLIILDIKLV